MVQVAQMTWLGDTVGAIGAVIHDQPLLTAVASCSALMTLGDVLAQKVEHRAQGPRPFDFARTRRVLLFAALLYAPGVTMWYALLDILLPGKVTLWIVLCKVLLDQTVWSGTVIAVFFLFISFMEGHSFPLMRQRCRDQWWPTLVVNWLVWPLVQLINLSLVPRQYQIVLVSAVSVPWNVFLSLRANHATYAPVKDTELV